MSTTTTAPPPPETCPAWCDDHTSDDSGNDSHESLAVRIGPASVYLSTAGPVEGEPAINIDTSGSGDSFLTLEEAEQLIALVRERVRVARAPEPAEESVVKTVRTVAEACGTTLEDVAAEIGADAAALTRGACTASDGKASVTANRPRQCAGGGSVHRAVVVQIDPPQRCGSARCHRDSRLGQRHRAQGDSRRGGIGGRS